MSDAAGRDARVSENMGLVHLIARRCRGRGLDMEDMAQLGALGLMRAAERFDPGRGRKFTTYATHWVRQAIGHGIEAGASSVRVNHHAAREAGMVARRMRAMAGGGPAPGLDEVLDAMVAAGEVPAAARERVGRAFLAGGRERAPIPVEEMEAGEGDPLASLIEDEERDQVRLALPLLPEPYLAVLVRSFGLDGSPPASNAAIGLLLGVHRATALRMRDEAVRMLRELVTAGPARRG